MGSWFSPRADHDTEGSAIDKASDPMGCDTPTADEVLNPGLIISWGFLNGMTKAPSNRKIRHS